MSTHRSVLELTVHNHPGVMSHVCGLLSRRAYNIEGIVCLPANNCLRNDDKKLSKIWLLVNEETRLEQVIKHIRKLYDVKDVIRHGVGHQVFTQLEELFSEGK